MKIQMGFLIGTVVRVVILATVTAIARGQSLPELDNEFVSIPIGPLGAFTGWTNFEIVVAGNQTGLLNAQNPNDTATNPFGLTGPNAHPAISASYNANNNTTLFTFSGNNDISSFKVPFSANDTAHFGLVGPTDGTMLTPLAKYWSGAVFYNGTYHPFFEPVAAVGINIVPPVPLPGVGPNVKFETIFAEYKQAGVVGGSWMEIPMVGNTPLNLQFISGSASPGNPISFLDAEYRITDAQIPLDNLNFEDLPPSAAGWTSMALPPDITQSVPETSSTFVLFGAAVIGLLARGRTRTERRCRSGI